jgi:DnaJ-class molecular chaperone
VNETSRVLDLIADDGYAATFQTLGQYRQALYRAVRHGSGVCVGTRIVECPECDGSGTVYADTNSDDSATCHDCRGTGNVVQRLRYFDPEAASK